MLSYTVQAQKLLPGTVKDSLNVLAMCSLIRTKKCVEMRYTHTYSGEYFKMFLENQVKFKIDDLCL